MDLTGDLEAYVTRRRDSKRELDLLRKIRKLPQAQRMGLLLPLLDLNARIALVLIGRAQLSRAAYLAIFNRGLAEADASSMRWWMEATVPHVGWRKVFSVLRETLATNPRRGASALYHVPSLCRAKAPSSLLSGSLPTRALEEEFFRLVELYHENGQVVITDPKVLQLVRDRVRGNA